MSEYITWCLNILHLLVQVWCLNILHLLVQVWCLNILHLLVQVWWRIHKIIIHKVCCKKQSSTDMSYIFWTNYINNFTNKCLLVCIQLTSKLFRRWGQFFCGTYHLKGKEWIGNIFEMRVQYSREEFIWYHWDVFTVYNYYDESLILLVKFHQMGWFGEGFFLQLFSNPDKHLTKTFLQTNGIYSNRLWKK